MGQHSIIVLETSNTEEINLFKALAKALKVKFELKKSPYNEDFVKKIENSRKDYNNGKGRTVSLEELNDLWK